MPRHPSPDDPELTVQEVANQLRVSKTTIYRYLEKGLLPGAWQMEKDWRIPQSAVSAYRERGGGAE